MARIAIKWNYIDPMRNGAFGFANRNLHHALMGHPSFHPLAHKLLPFVKDQGSLQRMSQNAAKLSTRNAASAVVEMIEKYTSVAE